MDLVTSCLSIAKVQVSSIGNKEIAFILFEAKGAKNAGVVGRGGLD